MKRLWLFACVLVLLAVPASASSVGAGVAYWDSEEAEDDNGFGLRFSLDTGPNWNMEFRASFFDGHENIFGVRQVGIEATPLDIGVSYDFNPDSRATFYAGGGFNYTLYDSTAFNLASGAGEASRVKDEPGWYVVVGVEGRGKSSVGFFAEALYRQNKPTVQGDGLNEFDVIPVDFAGVGATVGISYNW